VMVKDAGFDGSLFGKVLAVFMTLGMVVVTTVIRRHKDVPMVPALGASAFLCSVFCAGVLLVSPASPGFAISGRDLALCAAFGLIQNAAGLSLFAMGSRHLRSSEAALLAALEVPLTPLWVWLALSEVPANATLIGGSIVIAAMLGHMLYAFWRERREVERDAWPAPNPERVRRLFAARDRRDIPTPPPPPYPRRPPRAA
jgi:drug/metabolite transporter (DMT)-like permease